MAGKRDEFTARVLRLVAEGSPIGFVRLGAETWPGRVPGDWVLALEDAVRDLNAEDLVRYAVGELPGGRYSLSPFDSLAEAFGISAEQITRVWATPAGFEAAGLTRRYHEVGDRHSRQLPHEVILPAPGAVWVDWTAYRHHGFHALGIGPIIREPLAVHRVGFPTHRHGTDFDEGGTVMPKMGTSKLTPEVTAEIKRLRAQGQTRAAVAKALGVSEATVQTYGSGATRRRSLQNPRADEVLELVRQGVRQSDVVQRLGVPQTTVSGIVRRARADGLLDGASAPATPAPVIAEYEGSVEVAISTEDIASLPPTLEPVFVAKVIQSESLRDRILKFVAGAAGPIDETDTIRGALQRQGRPGISGHEVQHVLQSLQRQGLVKFRVDRVGTRKTMQRIEATSAGWRAVGLSEPPKPERPRPQPTRPEAHGDHARGGPIERVKVEDVHEHDADVWRADCAACKVYHPDGQTHGAAEQAKRPRVEPVAELIERAAIVATDATAGFPLLVALRARAAVKQAASASAERYLAAAAILEGINDQERDHLLELAGAAEGEPFTNLEAEYLRFFEACNRTDLGVR